LTELAHEIVGLAPEQLSLRQARASEGLWAAFRVYTPETLPLRKIEAVGKTAAEALAAAAARGGDARQFEAVRLHFLR
jgi:hypothetical protein